MCFGSLELVFCSLSWLKKKSSRALLRAGLFSCHLYIVIEADPLCSVQSCIYRSGLCSIFSFLITPEQLSVASEQTIPVGEGRTPHAVSSTVRFS